MDYNIFAKSTVGYKNRIKNKKSQDYMYYKKYEECIIVAIADGHGINRCMLSNRGAEFASKACIEVLTDLFFILKEEKDNILEVLTPSYYEKTISERIHSKWKEYVYEDYIKRVPNVYKIDYILYGTTLIGALITNEFNIYLQIGDGNIVEYKNEKFNIVNYNKKNKTRGVLNSMYLDDASKFIDINISLNNTKDNKLVVLFSDGYTNSFRNYDELFKDIKNTIINYNKNIFTRHNTIKDYDKYLDYLAINKSKDDISIIFII